MRSPISLCLILVSLSAAVLSAADYPTAQISNGLVTATLNLPDPERGYYRGTRFDWSGQIPELEYMGHSYFGEWNQAPYSPTLHDAIMGPVEEFLTNGAGLGYAEAKAGETFVKIGVGAIRKPEEKAFRQFQTYEIADPGKWTIQKRSDAVVFTQTVTDAASGYAYVYTKTVRLAKGKPQLVLEHRLTNTGKKAIESDVYEHNFYVIDKQPVGPEIVVKFPFDVHAAGDFHGLAETKGHQLVYLKELQRGQTAQSELTGFGSSPKDYNIVEENLRTHAGVRQTSDRPVVRINYWSIRSTACPEAYIHMNIAPGKDFAWKIVYDFYAKQ
jgi:hypothetical protein